MKHQVIRPFSATGRIVQAGEIVDTTEWRPRNVEALTRLRYLQPIFESSVPSSVPASQAGQQRPRNKTE